MMLAMTCVLAGILSAKESVRLYSHAEDPRRNPDYTRHHVKPPDPDLLGHRVHFGSLRGMGYGIYKELLDQFVDRDRLGDIIWANYNMLDRPDLADRVAELKRRGLFLFDMWGFVPGCETPDRAGSHGIPNAARELFERELGDHWLGMDNGEYDGNYIHGWADLAMPFGGNRVERYLEFQNFFERFHQLQGNKLATTLSLNFGHYFLKEGCFTMIGAESGQCLPNAQLFYSFIRGAGKQYGVPWHAAISIFNRWGWKVYQEDMRTLPPEKYGPGATKGTSLALLKRLVYQQLFGNCSVIGLEGSHYITTKKDGDVLSPIGRLQRRAMDWYDRNGDPGILQTPVALMFDFYQGWTFPRHQYKHEIFRVWGMQPYDEGDHFADGVLEMLYPGYADSGYFRDERGFLSPTPYGDIADCILSDTAAWQLDRYGVVVLVGKITPGAEMRDTLSLYAARGGHLVMTAGNARSLFPNGLPKGKVTVLPGGEWGVEEKPQCAVPVNYFKTARIALPRPHPLKPETRAALDGIFRSQRLFAASDDDAANGLSIMSCRRARGDWTLCVLNETWEEKPLAIRSIAAGRIVSMEELPADASERNDIGFGYDGSTNLVIGADSPSRIAGGAVRLFRVKTEEGDGVADMPELRPVPNSSRNVFVLRGNASIKETILRRPTFFRNYGGVMVDWRYLAQRSLEQVERERNWIAIQGLDVLVDLSSGLNLFPDLRLSDNCPEERERTDKALADLICKMSLIGAKDLVVAKHVNPELGMKPEVAAANQYEGLRRLCRDAAAKGITVHLRQSPFRSTPTLAALASEIKTINAANLRPAPSLAALLRSVGGDVAAAEKAIRAEKDAAIWLLSTPALDEHNQPYSLHEPIAGVDARLVGALREKIGARMAFDALYRSSDDEWRDARLFGTEDSH